MTFLNLFMLFGVAAASIPLVIHLLNRSKYEIIDWGAMHLLQAVIEENNRRIKIYEFLLLLIRCLIPIILALCLARPLVNQFAIGGSNGNVNTLVILDDSVSMSRLDGTGETRLQRGIEVVNRLKERLGNDANLQVLPNHNEIPPAAYAGNFDLPARILQGLNLARDDRNAAYEILVVSDYQFSGLESLDEQVRNEVMETIESLPIRPAISFLQLGTNPGPERPTNVRISRLELESERLTDSETILLSAIVTNEGSEVVKDLPVELLLDSNVALTQTVQINANSSRSVEFEYQLPPSDNDPEQSAISTIVDHLLTVRCQIADDCEPDNLAHRVVSVVPPIRTAIIPNLGRSSLGSSEVDSTGSGRETSFENSAEFLTVALSPYAFAGNGETQIDRISAVRINGKRLRLEDLSGFDVLVLVDPGELNQETVDQITKFVSAGGGLLVFAGIRAEAAIDSLNSMISQTGAGWINGELRGLDPGSKHKATIQSNRFAHPSMQLFNDQSGASAIDATFDRWIEIRPLEDLEQKDRGQEDIARAVVMLSNGQPLAIESQVGLGTVIFCTSTADTTWNNLPLRPAYLPMMQKWVDYLASLNQPSKNETAGTAAVYLVDDSVALEKLQLTSPSGANLELEERTLQPLTDDMSAQRLLVCTNTIEAGVYRLTTEDGDRQLFVSNPTAEELSSDVPSGAQLSDLADKLDANVADSLDQYFQSRVERALGFEVWYWIWWCVLALMVAERIVVWMLGRIS